MSKRELEPWEVRLIEAHRRYLRFLGDSSEAERYENGHYEYCLDPAGWGAKYREYAATEYNTAKKLMEDKDDEAPS